MALSAAQQEMRRNGVFSSDIAVVAGLIPKTWDRSTWMDLYLSKVGDLPEWGGSKSTRRGDAMAPFIAERTGEVIGRKVRRDETTVFHPTIRFAGATPDYVTDDADAHIIECKYVGFFMAKGWKDGPPDYVRAQITWQLGVTGKKHGYVAAFIEGAPNDKLIDVFPVEFDESLWTKLLFLAERFWTHVEKRQPPEGL